MKNVDFKKLFILIGIIAVIAAVILLITKLGGKNLTKEETKNVEDASINYYANLTEGYATPYGGIDILFQKDEVTFDKLETREIINTSIKYATDKGFDTSISENKINLLKTNNNYGKIEEYALYNGESIRKAIKELFGDVEYIDASSTNNYNYLYDYIYDRKSDVYLVKRNSVKSQVDKNQSLEYKHISTKAKDKKAIVTLAITYVYNDGKTSTYAKDPLGETIIAEEVKEFPEDKINEFDKYEITLSQTKDGKYVFESLKKVK